MLAECAMATPEAASGEDRYPHLAQTLARIFDLDPHFNWLVRQDQHRQAALSRLFRLLLDDMAVPHGDVHVSPDGQAVAIGFPPGGGRLSLAKQLRFLRAYLAISGWLGLPRRALGLQWSELHRPRRPHYYLQVVGVAEESRGQGRGRALLEPILRRCDVQGVPAYLETGNPANLGFYARLGFTVLGSYRLPGNLKLWRLWREPEPACAPLATERV